MAKCGELQISLDRANKELGTERRRIIELQAASRPVETEEPGSEPRTARCSGDFAADDEYCAKMGISDNDSEDDDLLGDSWMPSRAAAVAPQQSVSANSSLSAPELLQLIRKGLVRRFGQGARLAFLGCGEQGGKISKQSFYDSVDKACGEGDVEWVLLSSRQKQAVWDKMEEEASFKNGALYFEAFSRIFFGGLCGVATRPRSNTTL